MTKINTSGMPTPRVWQTCRFVWEKENVLDRLVHCCCIHYWKRVLQRYAAGILFMQIIDTFGTDVRTLDILRGFQGIGAAAQIPASV